MSIAQSNSGGNDDWRVRLQGLSPAEQVEAMEFLWSELSKNAESFQPPAWHGEILAERRKSIEDGTAVLIDWEDVKRELREKSP